MGQIYQDRVSSTTVDKRAHSGPSLSFDAGCEVGKTMVEIGANRQSCEPSTILLFKLVLEVVLAIAAGCPDRRTPVIGAGPDTTGRRL